MYRLFLHLCVAVLTFVIGTFASLFFNGVVSPSPEVASQSTSTSETGCRRRAVSVLKTREETIPGRCGCTESFTESELAADEATQGAPISGGILNGRAISLPQPPYPPIARAARASGTVAVEIVVDERGCIISARARAGGHPLLQQAAVQAAYQACFPPTRLSGKPVKVTGVITYNFVLQEDQRAGRDRN